MELKWLEDFICLANIGSFSQAAENRNVTQSAFSRRIMALEKWLGTTLIDRTSHPIRLTEDGTRFVETAKQSVHLFHKVRNDFNSEDSSKRRSLTIGIADHLAIHFFPSWLRQIEGSSPEYYFALLSSIKSGVSFFESLRSQEYDFLICYRGAINVSLLDPKNFASLTLGQESLIPVCKSSLLESMRYFLPGTPDKPLPYISYKPYSLLAKEVIQLTTLSSVAPIYLETVMETSSAQSIKSLVMQGYGVAWLPESAVEKEIQSGELKVIGNEKYYIPLVIEIHRHMLNTKAEIMGFWQKLVNNYMDT
ncbi:LysR family transcriptional regulator [Agarilytica rhodophyticola]|uniref:LysR family transcriptional regulator n=1 Tax=Agarilytica rhodophyticola TaxID=1737490 RepID=UPI000B342AC7|nr:LysR family transcriptional regulator [Agarilytica rhodophyticola]